MYRVRWRSARYNSCVVEQLAKSSKQGVQPSYEQVYTYIYIAGLIRRGKVSFFCKFSRSVGQKGFFRSKNIKRV